jgi:hypothetical protein
VCLPPKITVMQLSSQEVNIRRLHTTLLLQYKLEATTMGHSRRPHTNQHNSCTWIVKWLTQIEKTCATPYGWIIANVHHSWFTWSKWASEWKTIFNPPAKIVLWCGTTQRKLCAFVCATSKAKQEFYDGVGVVLWSAYVIQKNRKINHKITHKNNTWLHISKEDVLLFWDSTFTADIRIVPLHAYVPHPTTKNHPIWMVPPKSDGMQLVSSIAFAMSKLTPRYSLHQSVSTSIHCVTWCSCVKDVLSTLHSLPSPFFHKYHHHHHGPVLNLCLTTRSMHTETFTLTFGIQCPLSQFLTIPPFQPTTPNFSVAPQIKVL